MRVTRKVGVLVGTMALVGAAVGSNALAAPSRSGAGVHGQTLSHVFIIMEENHALDHTIGDINPATGQLSMPFLTRMAHKYGQATQYYGVTHTSEPNYIAATSGSNWGVNNDDGWYPTSTNPNVNHYDHTDIVDELDAAHIPWAAYMQAMPSAGYLPDSGNGGLYLSKHNPFVLYNDIHNNPSVAKNIKPYSDMARELNSAHSPRYVWISPDICTDMHLGVYSSVPGFENETPCPYPNAIGDPVDEASKTVADNFIRRAVSTIMNSKAWTGNSVIFITADETDYDASMPAIGDYFSAAGCCDSPVLPAGDPDISPDWPGGVYGGGLVPMVVISRQGPMHATDGTAYNHYSMLLTIEEGLGLGKLGYTSDSAQVKPMWSLINRP
ncbi:MAG TPA: alkaline phosphatase family protein [Nocardioidaceae bacterium]|nr:alkaline phosphatase family protein [Nocardioidaceae bacterium]